jgi:hypothetical protein
MPSPSGCRIRAMIVFPHVFSANVAPSDGSRASIASTTAMSRDSHELYLRSSRCGGRRRTSAQAGPSSVCRLRSRNLRSADRHWAVNKCSLFERANAGGLGGAKRSGYEATAVIERWKHSRLGPGRRPLNGRRKPRPDILAPGLREYTTLTIREAIRRRDASRSAGVSDHDSSF